MKKTPLIRGALIRRGTNPVHLHTQALAVCNGTSRRALMIHAQSSGAPPAICSPRRVPRVKGIKARFIEFG